MSIVKEEHSLSFRDIIGTSFIKLKGCKFAIIVPLLFGYGVLLSVMDLMEPLRPSLGPYLMEFLAIMVSAILIAPFLAGICKVALNQTRGYPIKLFSGFYYFNKTIPLAIVLAIESLLQMLPTLLMSLASPSAAEAQATAVDKAHVSASLPLAVSSSSTLPIGASAPLVILALLFMVILSLALSFAPFFIVEENKISPKQAIFGSLHFFKKHPFLTLGIHATVYFLIFITAIPMYCAAVYNKPILIVFSLPIVWFFPMIYTAQACLYERILHNTNKEHQE